MNASDPTWRRTLRLVCLAVLLCGIGATAITGVTAALMGSFDSVIARLLWTSVTVLIAGNIALIQALAMKAPRLRPMLWGGLAATVTGAACVIVLIWGHRAMLPEIVSLWRRSTGTLAVLSISAAMGGHLGVIRTPSPVLAYVQRGLFGLVGFAACLVLMMMWTRWWMNYEEIFAFTAATVGLACLGGLVALPRLAEAAVRRRGQQRESIPTSFQVELACPRCSSERPAALGLSRCAECGFKIIVEVEEPRCECGYLLFNLAGERCPECGRLIAQEDRWLASRDEGPGTLTAAGGTTTAAG